MAFKDKIIEVIERKKQKLVTFDELARDLGLISGFDRQALASTLNELVREDKIVFTKRNKYTLPENSGAIKATIYGNPNGYGFARPFNDGEDIFIPERALNGATHGDTVLVKVIGKNKGRFNKVKGQKNSRKNRQGEVISILDRGYKTLVGVFESVAGGGIVTPDDARFADNIFIQADKISGAKNNTKVVVKILEYPSRTRMAQGEVVEVLGDPNNFKVTTLSVIRSFGYIEEFPKEALVEADEVNKPVDEEQIKGRKDFRGDLIITIDGEDARDFDDAISLKMNKDNFVLSVHIADVSSYVKEGGSLDKEAYRRGTSVYFPDYVLPMLPKVLSNGICSLNPNEDRLSMSVIMEFDKNGNIVNYNICEGVIRSLYRMTYTEVTKIFDGDSQLKQKYAKVVPMLEKMAVLAKLLLKRRDDAGQIDFDLPEAQINMDEEGKIVEIIKKPRNLSDRLIEQFMVITNEVIAKHCSSMNLPFVYRVHEEPTPERVKAFRTFISSFGLKLTAGSEGAKPKDFQKLLLQIKGTAQSQPISKIMLRSMQKARYSPENLGHFGLALKNYCHFTSPIRRYPDLVIHRIIKYMLKGQLSPNKTKVLESFVIEASEQSSVTERQADEAERAVDDLKKAEYMSNRIGEVYEGNVSSVTESGVYVELDNTIEGFIYKEDLPEDRYYFDEARYMLVGKRNRFSLGDRLQIKVLSVDINTRHIDFTLAPPNSLKK